MIRKNATTSPTSEYNSHDGEESEFNFDLETQDEEENDRSYLKILIITMTEMVLIFIRKIRFERMGLAFRIVYLRVFVIFPSFNTLALCMLNLDLWSSFLFFIENVLFSTWSQAFMI